MRSQDDAMTELAMDRWCLESLANGGKTLRRVPIHTLPFRIGRRPGLDLTLPSLSVSKLHAEICRNADGLVLRDLHSTNGTFVNRERVETICLREGDIVHFADFEFRVGLGQPDELSQPEESEEFGTIQLGGVELPREFVEGTRELGELLRDAAVRPAFQPIVSLDGGRLVAYEVLGRGRHPHLPESPAALFRIAETVGAEAMLSQLFIRKALETVAHRTDLPTLFLNTHPVELQDPELPRIIGSLAQIAPHIQLVLEFHEEVLDNLPLIARLKAEFCKLHIGLAYDDVGAGRARLLELGDVPPDYLKFDIRLIRGIDHAPDSRRRLISSFLDFARDLDIQTIAEGIEREPEADVCAELGFGYGQGFLYGQPKAIDMLP